MADSSVMDSIKQKLDAMDPKKRQNLIKGALLGGVIVLMFSLYYMTGQDKKKPPPPKEPAKVIELGDAALEDDMRAQFAKGQQAQEAYNQAQDKELTQTKDQIAKQDAQIKAMQSVLEAVSKGPATSLPDVAAPADGSQPSTDPMDWQNGMPPVSGAAGARPAGQGAAGQPAAPTVEYMGDIGEVQGTQQKGGSDGSKKKNPRFYLPPSFMPAKLLTGLAAKTVEGSKSDPEPIMLRVQAPAVLPNEVRAQLEGCLVVGHGYGSLASERVEAQLVSISCLDFAGKSMIDAELHGIVVDKDGVKGLAGHPVSKMATNLARLAFAGAIQGASAALSASATTNSVSALGQTQTIDTSQLGKAAIGKGIEKPSDEYVRIMADLVRQQAPVIEVGPSKDVTVVVTEGTWLELKDYQEGP